MDRRWTRPVRAKSAAVSATVDSPCPQKVRDRVQSTVSPRPCPVRVRGQVISEAMSAFKSVVVAGIKSAASPKWPAKMAGKMALKVKNQVWTPYS